MDVMGNNTLIEATCEHFVLIIEKRIGEIVFSAKYKLRLKRKGNLNF